VLAAGPLGTFFCKGRVASQPRQGDLARLGNPRLQPETEERRRTPAIPAHARGPGDTSQYLGRAAARPAAPRGSFWNRSSRSGRMGAGRRLHGPPSSIPSTSTATRRFSGVRGWGSCSTGAAVSERACEHGSRRRTAFYAFFPPRRFDTAKTRRRPRPSAPIAMQQWLQSCLRLR
jgi:hypothetical protein